MGRKNVSAKPQECKCILIVLRCWRKFLFGAKCTSYQHSKWRVTCGRCVCLANRGQQEHRRGGTLSAPFPNSSQHFFLHFSSTNGQQMGLTKRPGLWGMSLVCMARDKWCFLFDTYHGASCCSAVSPLCSTTGHCPFCSLHTMMLFPPLPA